MPALDIHMIESLSRELHPTSNLMSETEVIPRYFQHLTNLLPKVQEVLLGARHSGITVVLQSQA